MRTTGAPGTILASLGAAFVLWLALTWDSAWTPDDDGETPLAELVPIELGGQRHYATIRSRSSMLLKGKAPSAPPVLLYLHGGPGSSDIAFLHYGTDRLLENHFVVVHYDQRSAGKSCAFFDWEERRAQELTIQQHVEDVVDMIEYLRNRFQHDKIYLLGGSWGSILALRVARDYPHLLHHVATRGIVINPLKSEQLANDFILSRLPGLEGKIPAPPYDDRLEDIKEQRGWLYRAGGMKYQCQFESCSRHGVALSILKAILTSPEMSWADTIRFHKCFMSTLKQMWPEMQQLDAREEITKLDVPFLALHGRHDHVCAAELVPAFVEVLEAPSKKLVWFEHSGHSPQMEEPMEFQRALIETFLNKTVR